MKDSKEKLNKEKIEQDKRNRVAKVVDNKYVVALMTAITVYALFFDDIRILLFPKSADNYFYGITLTGIILFTAEIIATSYSKDEYVYSFFFWLDIISTVSMIPDCGWIWDPYSGENESASIAKTSRAGRATRIIRVIRLIRLIRIVKLYKQ